jgi:hypothetical protein
VANEHAGEEPTSDVFAAGEEGLGAELFATQMALPAIIKSHPDRAALLAEFEAIVTSLQLHSAAHGGVPLSRPLTHDSVQRFRDQSPTAY